VIEILEFLAALRQNASLPHCHKDAEAAGLLAGASATGRTMCEEKARG
jgi:hypothetical protein